MCLWLLTACLGFLPSNPTPRIVVPPLLGVPAPILQPTQAPTVVPTTISTLPSTTAPTTVPTTIPTMATTVAPTSAPSTAPNIVTTTTPAMVSTAIPTTAPTAAPTTTPAMVSTAIPTTVPTAPPTMTPATVSTAIPTTASTAAPTTTPAMVSTAIPTTAPTAPPTTTPASVSTAIPTTASTAAPTSTPAMVSTAIPTTAPTAAPTTTPTMVSTAVTTTASTTTTTMAPTAVPTMASTTATSMASTMAPTMVTNNTVTTTASPPIIIITTGGELSPLILCNDPDIVCIINPDEIITGSSPFDPRLGTTPGTSAAYHSAVTGYSAHIPTYNNAVRFPREKRSIDQTAQENKEDVIPRNNNMKHKIQKRETCRCVPRGMCPARSPNLGAGLIDIRIVTPGMQCPDNQEYCCMPYSVTPTATPTPTPIPTIPCGTLQPVPATSVVPAPGQANYGEFPWQAAITTKQNDFIAGGVLINNLNVLTVTHRVGYYLASSNISTLKVRLGDWDGTGVNKPVNIQEYNVSGAFVHPNFTNSTLQYDLMILRLATPVPFTPAPGAAVTINRACLPPSSKATYHGMRCMVSGWGKNMFGLQGQYQAIIKKVEVPIVPPATCQNQLRATRLGPNFVLDTNSFVCAGGEPNKDSCTGDGGSGLVCQVNGQWVVVGLVAWGLSCADPNVPGVYVNIAALLPWIQQQIAMS